MQSMKILWIEDDAKELKSLVWPLEKDGHEIIFAEDKEEALTIVKTNIFNLIIVDLIIPTGEKNDKGDNHFVGVNLIRILKEILKEKNITTPIIVLSVVRDHEIIEEIRNMGIKKFLPKGAFLPSLLKKEIYDILGVKNK